MFPQVFQSRSVAILIFQFLASIFVSLGDISLLTYKTLLYLQDEFMVWNDPQWSKQGVGHLDVSKWDTCNHIITGLNTKFQTVTLFHRMIYTGLM